MRNRFTPTSRYIPADSTEIAHPDGLAVVYCYTGKNDGRVSAIAYTGKAMKSAWHFSFPYKDVEKAKERRAEKIKEYFAGLESWKKMHADFKAERSQPHDFKVGEIVVNSWGYDQTNIDFYEIVKVSSNYVWLREICGTVKETGFMSGDTAPVAGVYKNEEITKHHADARGYVNFKFGAGYRHGRYGKTEHCSWYA